MPTQLWTFDREAMLALKRDHDRMMYLLRDLQDQLARLSRESSPLVAYMARTDATGITAASGTTPGSGNVELYRRNGTTLSDTNLTRKVYTMGAAVPADHYVQIKRDMYGTWWIDDGGSAVKKGTLDADLTAGGTVTVSIWALSAGAEADTGDNVTDVRDWLLGSGKKLVSGTKVVIARIASEWYVIAAGSCPVNV